MLPTPRFCFILKLLNCNWKICVLSKIPLEYPKGYVYCRLRTVALGYHTSILLSNICLCGKVTSSVAGLRFGPFAVRQKCQPVKMLTLSTGLIMHPSTTSGFLAGCHQVSMAMLCNLIAYTLIDADCLRLSVE